jgi:hypothetical protein
MEGTDSELVKRVYELVVLAIVTIVISPVSWRHHYILTLIPVIYLWTKLGERWRDILVLAAATIAMGTVFPDCVIVSTSKPLIALVLSSLMPVTSLLLLWVLCRNYESPEVLSSLE